MEKNDIDIDVLQDKCLSIHNKVQEAIKLARDGKWYLSDTKLQGVRQKVLDLHCEIGKMKKNENS